MQAADTEIDTTCAVRRKTYFRRYESYKKFLVIYESIFLFIMKKLKLIMVVLEINHLPQNYNKCNVCRRCYINFFKPDMRINDRLYKMRLELNLEKFHFANVP